MEYGYSLSVALLLTIVLIPLLIRVSASLGLLVSLLVFIGAGLVSFAISRLRLAALLMSAIKMTRRQFFSLNTQDLLILLVVILFPLLPFGDLGQYQIGKIALTVAVLMYASEFILARSASLIALPAASAVAAVSLLPI